MHIEFRPATAEEPPCKEMGQFGTLAGYVYGGAYGDRPNNLVASATRPEWTLCAFEGSRLVSSFSTIPFTMRTNGTALPIGGVSAVGTLPCASRHWHHSKPGGVRRANCSHGVCWTVMRTPSSGLMPCSQRGTPRTVLTVSS